MFEFVTVNVTFVVVEYVCGVVCVLYVWVCVNMIVCLCMRAYFVCEFGADDVWVCVCVYCVLCVYRLCVWVFVCGSV